jgi:hypothetical protein
LSGRTLLHGVIYFQFCVRQRVIYFQFCVRQRVIYFQFCVRQRVISEKWRGFKEEITNVVIKKARIFWVSRPQIYREVTK